MVVKKQFKTALEAVSKIRDGSTVMISGFGDAGNPTQLVHALISQGAKKLTVVNNNAGTGHLGLAKLLKAGRVKKVICSFPRSSKSVIFQDLYKRGKIELEVVPQGTLVERIRAAGSGIPAFYTATAVGTPLAIGKEEKIFNGKKYILEKALNADFALVKADISDRYGNLTFKKTFFLL